MWLYIETTRPDAFTLGLLGGKKTRRWNIKGRSHAVVNEIMKRVELKQLIGICAVSGPGSFTSTRTGVMVANVLARQLRLPLVGVNLEEAIDLDVLARQLPELLPLAFVAPHYSAEPNITVKTC